MNALTEHQPWASLQAHGLQTVETRSWRPPRRAVGQRLAIHAGKTVIEDPRETGWETWNAARELYGDGWPASVPTGAVIATATLKAALLVAEQGSRGENRHRMAGRRPGAGGDRPHRSPTGTSPPDAGYGSLRR